MLYYISYAITLITTLNVISSYICNLSNSKPPIIGSFAKLINLPFSFLGQLLHKKGIQPETIHYGYVLQQLSQIFLLWVFLQDFDPNPESQIMSDDYMPSNNHNATLRNLSIMFNVISILVYIIFKKRCNEVKLFFTEAHDEIYYKNQDCEKCKQQQKPLSQHCDSCNKCVRHKYYHSFYFNKCVSRRNAVYFLVLLSLNLLSHIFAAETMFELWFNPTKRLCGQLIESFATSFKIIVVEMRGHFIAFLIYFSVALIWLALAFNDIIKLLFSLNKHERTIRKPLIKQLQDTHCAFIIENLITAFHQLPEKQQTPKQLKKLLQKYAYYDFIRVMGHNGLYHNKNNQIQQIIPLIIQENTKTDKTTINNNSYEKLSKELSVQLFKKCRYNYHCKTYFFDVINLINDLIMPTLKFQ